VLNCIRGDATEKKQLKITEAIERALIVASGVGVKQSVGSETLS